jgi:FkbM family methyltransferase
VKASLGKLIESATVEATGPTTQGHSGEFSPKPVLRVSKVTNPATRGLSAVADTWIGILQYFPDQEPAGRSIGWYGEFLRSQADFLAAIIQPGATVIEAAGGIGVHTLALAAAIGSAGHLIVFESRRPMHRALLRNLSSNRVAGVTVLERMLGRRINELVRQPAPSDPGTMRESSSQGQTLVDVLDDHKLQRLDLLKTNLDANALQVLEGASDTLWRLRPLLFLATNDEAGLTVLAQRVKQMSYRCWRHETALFNPNNFNRRVEDIFSGQTALALLAIPEEAEVDIDFDRCVEI